MLTVDKRRATTSETDVKIVMMKVKAEGSDSVGVQDEALLGQRKETQRQSPE